MAIWKASTTKITTDLRRQLEYAELARRAFTTRVGVEGQSLSSSYSVSKLPFRHGVRFTRRSQTEVYPEGSYLRPARPLPMRDLSSRTAQIPTRHPKRE